MKKIGKYILTLLMSGVLFFSFALVQAQTTGTYQIRSNVQSKIRQFKDQNRQKSAEKIIRQTNHINKTLTNHFNNVLDKLEFILNKVDSRAKKAAINGQDVSSVNTAIQKAKEAIAAARTAVANQSKKTYDIDVSTITQDPSAPDGQNALVSTFREQFQSLRDQLKQDLFSLRDGAVKNAKNAVQDTFKALSKVPNVDKEPEANSK